MNPYWYDPNTLEGWDTDRFTFPNLDWYKTKKAIVVPCETFVISLLETYSTSNKTIFIGMSTLTKTSFGLIIEIMLNQYANKELPYWDKEQWERALTAFIISQFRIVDKWSTDFANGYPSFTIADINKIITASNIDTSNSGTTTRKHSDTPQGSVTDIDNGFLSSLDKEEIVNGSTVDNGGFVSEVKIDLINKYYEGLQDLWTIFSDRAGKLFSKID